MDVWLNHGIIPHDTDNFKPVGRDSSAVAKAAAEVDVAVHDAHDAPN